MGSGTSGTSGAPTTSVAPANYYSSPAAMTSLNTGYATNAGNIAKSMGNYGLGTGTGLGSMTTSSNAGYGGYNPLYMPTVAPKGYYQTSTAAPANYYQSASAGLRGISMTTPSGGVTPGGNTSLPTSATPEGSTRGPEKKDYWGILQKNSPMLLNALGMLIPNPKPDFPSAESLKSQLSTPATPEGAAARTKMIDYINNPQNIGGQATADYLAAIEADYAATDAKALADFDASWAAQGKNFYGSDYNNAKADFMGKQARAKNLATTGVRNQLMQLQVNAQLQMIANAYGVDTRMLEDLMNMEITEASIKYGMDVEKINQFRQTIYNMALMQEYNKGKNSAQETLTTAVRGLQPGQGLEPRTSGFSQPFFGREVIPGMMY